MIGQGLGPAVVCSVTKGVTKGRRMLYQPELTVRSFGVAGVGQPVYPRTSVPFLRPPRLERSDQSSRSLAMRGLLPGKPVQGHGRPLTENHKGASARGDGRRQDPPPPSSGAAGPSPEQRSAEWSARLSSYGPPMAPPAAAPPRSPVVQFPSCRRFDRARAEANDAMMALLIGSRLASHLLAPVFHGIPDGPSVVAVRG